MKPFLIGLLILFLCLWVLGFIFAVAVMILGPQIETILSEVGSSV